MRVTKAIEKALKEKDRGIISGVKSMRSIMKDLHGQVMAELGKAALGTWDSYHLRQFLDSIEFQMANYTGVAKTEMSGLLDRAWATGKDLVDKPLLAAGIQMGGYHLGTSVLDQLKEYSSDYLGNMFGDAWHQVKGEISLGIVGGKTPQEVAKAIGENMDSGRFRNIARRAETITQTEMGTVFSVATQKRMEQAAEKVEGLEKEWKHVGHPMVPRLSHLAADGQHVPVDKPFVIGGVKMMFPRDPGAPIGEIIHCGCDHVPYHALWERQAKGEETRPYEPKFDGIKGRDLRVNAEDAMKDAPPEIARIVERYAPDVKARRTSGGSHYDFTKKTILISSDAVMDGNTRSFAHEFGHFVDMDGGREIRPDRAFSVRGPFADALRAERNEIVADKAKLARLQGDINNMTGQWNRNPGLSDLFGAVTNNMVVGRFGHWGGYYADRPGWGAPMQAFANLFAMAAQKTDGLEYIQKELPRLWAEFQVIINGL